MKNIVFKNTVKSYILTLVCVMVVFIAVYFNYLFGHFLYIFQEPNNDYLILAWPLKAITQNIFHTNSEFSLGLYTSIYSIKGFLYDPFYFLISFFNLKNVPYLIIYIYSLQTFAITTILFFIVNKLLNANLLLTILMTIMITFNGMFIYWSTQDSFFSAIVYILLFWYGYLYLKKNNSIYVFISCAILLFMFSFAYSLITFSIFFIPYIILDKLWDNETAMVKFRSLFRLFCSYLVLFGISAWCILPELYVLSHNHRVSGHLKQNLLHLKLTTQIGTLEPLDLYNLKLYAQLILRGFGNYTIPFDKIWVSAFSGPLWYSSIFLLVSAVAYIIINLKQRKVRLNFIITGSLVFLFLPFIILLFNGFSDVRFRWTWFFLLPLTICAVKFWQQPNMKKFRLSLILLVLVFLSAACYEYKMGDLYFTDHNVLITYIVIITIFCLLFLFSYLKRYTLLVLGLVGVCDTLFNAYMFIHNAKPMEYDYLAKHMYYYDNTNNAVNLIKKQDRSIFYRMDKTYSSLNAAKYYGLNENLLQGYNGVKAYSSTLNPYYYKFSEDMDAKPYYNFIFGFDGRYDVLRMLGVKYLLSKDERVISGYTLQQKFNDIYIYQASNYKGIGHVFDKYITRSEFMLLSTANKDLVFSRCAIISDGLVATLNVKHANAAQCLLGPSVLDNKNSVFTLQKLDSDEIKGAIGLSAPGILYIAIPFDFATYAEVDGKQQNLINIGDGFIGLELTSGAHNIDIKHSVPLRRAGIIISVLTALLLCVLVYIYRRFRKRY